MMAAAAQVAAEGEYSKAKSSVWWDIENCAVPKSWDAHEISLKLNSELMKMNYCGPLSISAYGNTNLISKSVQQALSSTGISLHHVPSGRKDASDKKILVDMLLWVLDNPAPANIMLISGDRDFSDALHRLRMRRYNILLAHPQQASVPLVASANVTWIWRSLLPSTCPPTQLVDNGSCPSQCETSLSRSKLNGIYVQKARNQLLQQQKTRRKKLQESCIEAGESVLFCKICNVDCKSFEHLSGKEHAAQWDLKQNLELFGENTVAAPSECHEKVSEMANKVVEAKVEASADWSLCSVVKKQAEALVDAKNIEESVQDNDLQSQDAQQYMKCLDKELMEETFTTSERSSGEFLQDFKERLESDGVAPVNVDCVLSELSRDFQVPKEVREWFDAILKKLEPSTNELVIEELESMLNHGLEMQSGESEKVPAGLTEHLEEDMNKTKKKKRKKKSTLVEDGAEPYICSICSFTCDHPTTFEFHVKSRKHNAKVKKHTEALLDKHIQGEMIQDIGQLKEVIEELRFQPGEAPENMNCLEKQNKELSEERCDTSEKSVEELLQNFQEVVEDENKSHPNAECVIAELKPELSAPKEARERTVAVIEKLEHSQDANVTWKLESIPDQNLEMNTGDSETNSAGANDHPEGNTDKKMKEKVAEDEAEREAYACSIPNAECIITELNPEFSARERTDAIIKKPELSQDANLTGELECIPDQNVEMNSGDPGSNSAGENDHPEENMDKKKKKDKVAKEREAYVCSVCSVTCDHPMVFETHLMGKKHAAKVKKHAEVLFDDKKILEESLKEKDHPTELPFQSREAQDSINEVCQGTDEERVGYESEQIQQSAEFPEIKEARERFDSIVERLELSLEETLKKKSSEADNASECERAEEEMAEEEKKKNGNQNWVCEWCNVRCNTKVNFDDHLAGKKHVKKHLAVLNLLMTE
uniref:Meiosis arrest female protein 1 n=1 Tax=Noccaea caerulescens TaxID=107243 RepID=A0A1J3CNX4_NOCCA